MKNSVITIGNFDGVHLGHQAILKKLVRVSQEEKLKSIVITFSNIQNSKNKLINTEEEKIDLLSKFLIDEILVLPLDKHLMSMSADDFFEKILIKKLNVKHIVVGYDATFGKDRQGNISWLKQKTKEKNIKLDIISPIKLNNKIISSSKIRQAILDNKIVLVNKMLGKFFEINGIHVSGNKIGRTIGVPTINVSANEIKILPKGVFGCYLLGKNNFLYQGILNIGFRPTLKLTDNVLSIEVHLLNFSGAWRQKKVKIFISTFVRKEKKFNSLNILKKQISKDINKIIQK